jgi:hypothetical protein
MEGVRDKKREMTGTWMGDCVLRGLEGTGRNGDKARCFASLLLLFFVGGGILLAMGRALK